MKIERLLQCNTAILVVLGSLLLGMGQGSGMLPFLAVVLAAISLIITDVKHWFSLHKHVASGLALFAAAVAVFDFFGRTNASQLSAIANLLTYLQFVLLFQKKSDRVYWQLIILSLLQVVVSAALNLGFEFGILLAAYLFAALSAMALFFIQREIAPFLSESDSATDENERPHANASVEKPLRRWPLVAQEAVLFSCPNEDPAKKILSWRFTRKIFAMGFMTLVFTSALFFMVPRFGTANWQRSFSSSAWVGFQEEMSLMRSNHIRESDAVAMRVFLSDNSTGAPYPIIGAPYIRGSVLVDYSVNGEQGRWTSLHLPQSGRERRVQPLSPPPDHGEIVRQDFVLEPSRGHALFAIYPIYSGAKASSNAPSDTLKKNLQGQLVRKNSAIFHRYRYSVTTTSLVKGRQIFLEPLAHPISYYEREAMLRFDPLSMPTLCQEASDAAHAAGCAPGDHYRIAYALEKHLRTSSKYTYDLDRNSQTKDPIDPIEDFVANHPRGHCEFFASTLCMMLRSQGIPARVVNGFHGGEYNAVGEYYQIKQRHAHAWVEAYLAPDKIPSGLVREGRAMSSGAWLRLDGIPESDMSPVAEKKDYLFAQMSDLMEYGQLLWSDYIVGLNGEKQLKAIYSPLTERISHTFQAVFNWKAWKQWFADLGVQWGITDWGTFVDRWFHWRAGLVAMLVSLIGVGIYQTLRKPFTHLFARWNRKGSKRNNQRRVNIRFYWQLQRILARQGLSRPLCQTPRQWAASIGKKIRANPSGDLLADGIEKIVEAYYQVRFGQKELDVQHRADINQLLLSLEHAFKKGERKKERRFFKNRAA